MYMYKVASFCILHSTTKHSYFNNEKKSMFSSKLKFANYNNYSYKSI
jgi:hypothetical protein